MDNTASGTGRQDDDTQQSPSSSSVMSKSTNISQSGSHRATTGPTLQGRPSYPTMAGKALSDERLDNAADASPGAASRRREPRATDNQTTAHPAAASKGPQATTEQFDVELNARSRAGKPPLDADNTQNDSAYMKSSIISASKETRAAQREGITNSGTTVSASSMQPPVHLVTNSPPSRNALPSRTLGENSSNISLPVVAPGPEETKKRNESPHPQEDSRSQRTVIRPYAEQVDRTASVQPSVKPSTSHPPRSSSSERRVNTFRAEQVDRTAPVQPSVRPSTSYPPPSPSSERANTPHAEQADRIASIQPSAKPFPSDHLCSYEVRSDRDDDGNPLVRIGQLWSRAGNSGDRPSRAVERDEQTHPRETRSRSRSPPSPPSTGRHQPNHPITLSSNTTHTEVAAVGRRRSRSRREAYSETKVDLPVPPKTRVPDNPPSESRSGFMANCSCDRVRHICNGSRRIFRSLISLLSCEACAQTHRSSARYPDLEQGHPQTLCSSARYPDLEQDHPHTLCSSARYPDLEQGRYDGRNTLVRLGQPSSRTDSSGDRPSRVLEWDEQTHTGAAHSRSRSPSSTPSTERDQPNQSTHPITLPSNTTHTEVTAVGQRSQESYSETNVNLSPPQSESRIQNEPSSEPSSDPSCCICLCCHRIRIWCRRICYRIRIYCCRVEKSVTQEGDN
ncbi:hypothetical protein F5888DRAFT_1707525 [Russula emetica]|nr:hypothetical protein F5888DRAFT_1707525 [Russula emetica]